MAKERKTGLGAAAFFQQPQAPASDPAPEQGGPQPDRPADASGSQQAASETKPLKKVRTTVLLYPNTLAGMDALKIQARRHGQKATYSDILEQAIRMLMEKHQIDV